MDKTVDPRDHFLPGGVDDEHRRRRVERDGAGLAVGERLTHDAGDALAEIDLASGQLRGSVPLPSRPGDLTVDGTSAWVAQPDSASLQQIDTASLTVHDTIRVGPDPTGVVTADGSVWVANGGKGERGK